MPTPADLSTGPLLPEPACADASERVPVWRLGNGGRTRFRRSRTRFAAFGLCAATLLTGIVTWATTRIGPAPRVEIRLIGTDYRSNFDLPPAGSVDRGLGQLAAWVSGRPPGPRHHVRLGQPPIAWDSPDAYRQLDDSSDAAVSVLFVAAHGIGTPQGPAILAGDAEGPESAVPIRELIDWLARGPRNQHKVLILDVAHTLALPSFGVLLNDFARQLKELDDEIRAVPNLVVLVSAEEGEVSRIDPSAGTTRFAAAFLRALNGQVTDSDRDGWVDLADLFHATRSATTAWSSLHCGEPQTPWVLPLGDVGQRRSGRIGFFPMNSDPVDIPPLRAETRADLVSRWWARYERYRSRRPALAVISPVTWRRFEATLLRWEQFEREGCRDAADRLERDLIALSRQLEKPAMLDSNSCRLGLIPAETVGFAPADDLRSLAAELAVRLAEKSPAAAADEWAAAAEKQPDTESVAFLRRTVIETHTEQLIRTWKDQREARRDQLEKAVRLLDAVDDPQSPGPQVGLLLRLLRRDLPAETLGSDDATRIARWLGLCLRGDRVSPRHPWWSIRTYPWISGQIEPADQARRLAGDLIFGDAPARGRADGYLTESEGGYAEVDRIAEAVAAAYEMRGRTPEAIRRIRSLLELRSVPPLDANLNQDVTAFERLCAAYDELELVAATHPPLTRLIESTASLKDRLEPLSREVRSRQRAALTAGSPDLPELLWALAIPGGSAEERLGAWDRLRRLTAVDASPATARLDRTPLAEIKRGAAIRGRVAIATWPARLFDRPDAIRAIGVQAPAPPAQAPAPPVPPPTGESRGEVVHRLEVFGAEEAWWRSLAQAGWQIGLRERAARAGLLDSQSSQRIEESDVGKRPDAASAATRPGDSRQIEPRALIDRLSMMPPAGAAREIRSEQRRAFAGLLLWQRDRFLADAYAGFDSSEPSYANRVATILASDVGGGSPDRPSPLRLQLQAPAEQVWTTQREQRFAAHIGTTGRHIDGFVAVEVTVPETVTETGPGSLRSAFELVQPRAGERICRPLSGGTSGAGGADADPLWISLRSDPPDGPPVRRDTPPSSATSAVAIRSYFRGRWLRHDVQLRSRPLPQTHAVDVSGPPGGRVAIRDRQGGTTGGAGGLAIVLDCSGSMGAPRGRAFDDTTKYSQAVDAVETLVGQLPSGVTLSLWAFGQAVGDGKTADPPERTIRQILPPTVWNRADSGATDRLVRSIRYPVLEPWNESPLMATMLAAAGDLRKSPGPRSLVVITDGGDNRIAHDPVANPLGLEPPSWIRRTFAGTGIWVNVIAYRVASAEREATRNQLRTVESLLPPGRFVEAGGVDELSTAIAGLFSSEPDGTFRLTPRVTGSGSGNLDPQTPTADADLGTRGQGPSDAAGGVTVPASPSHGPAKWVAVDAGGYTIGPADSAGRDEAWGGHRPATATDVTDPTPLRIADGDRLLLGVDPGGHVGLWPSLDQELRWAPKARAGRWRVALVPDPGSDAGWQRRQLVFAPDPDADGLSLTPPSEVWVAASSGGSPVPTRWRRDWEQPGIAYDVKILANRSNDLRVRVWVADRPTTAVAVLRKGHDFSRLSDLGSVAWDLSAGPVRLESATIETHGVADDSGREKPQSCLVVRGSAPPGAIYRWRTTGLSAGGWDAQSFPAEGQFTFRQWPVTEADADRLLRTVELVSIDRFRRDAELAGHHAGFPPEPGGSPEPGGFPGEDVVGDRSMPATGTTDPVRGTSP